MKKTDMSTFKIFLDENYEWPCQYLFKFIVPKGQIVAIKDLFSDCEIKERPSKTGKYISVTFFKTMSSSNEVLECYEKTSDIQGVIAL